MNLKCYLLSEKSYTYIFLWFYTKYNTLLVFIKRIEFKHYFLIQQIFQTVNRAKALYLEKYYFIHGQVISLLACDRILKESCCSINYLRWKKNDGKRMMEKE